MEWSSIFNDLINGDEWSDKLILRLAESFIEECFSDELKLLMADVSRYNGLCDDVKSLLRVDYIFHTKNFSSLLKDPLEHLHNVLYAKLKSLLVKKPSIDDFKKIANLTVKKCVDTNLRILFQNFVALSILYVLHSFNPRIVYPENGWLHLTRSRMQKDGRLPPNFVVMLDGNVFLSFFLEAPRPIKWSVRLSDASNLPLHAAPRPDLMIYFGWVDDILSDGSEIIKSPDILIECKEMDGWWKSKRRSEGIRHLTNGGIENVSAIKVIETYANLYNPGKIFLISKVKVPRGVKYMLSLRNVETIDDVGLNPFNIRRLADFLVNSKC